MSNELEQSLAKASVANSESIINIARASMINSGTMFVLILALLFGSFIIAGKFNKLNERIMKLEQVYGNR